MRIIGGLYKGIKLNIFNGKEIRPTPSIVREAVFDILGARVIDSEFLDLFAGTGAVGFEAFSRGARWVTFVELNKKSIELIKKNMEIINHRECFHLIKSHYIQAIEQLKNDQQKFDIIFLDPPYNHVDYLFKSLQEIELSSILKRDNIILVQHCQCSGLKYDSQKLFLLKEKKYGRNRISIFHLRE
ncbi:MAG: 16S rRNA (guanine(966)-N(2))-methyltransferase RsmD [Candidatus Atribacteria bacterium]|nr:16S rRNA (guanine(966)-N(2))-methyltransferase RsmD [Candidatus Atribacteria bacterium]